MLFLNDMDDSLDFYMGDIYFIVGYISLSLSLLA